MNRLFWLLPSVVHTLVVILTGWRLGQFTNLTTGEKTYRWIQEYPVK